MARFAVTFACDNAAFANGELCPEIARILIWLGINLRDHPIDAAGPAGGALRDYNGNRVGEWRYEP